MRSKEDVRVVFLWRAFEIFSQGEDVESFGDFSGGEPLEKLDDLSECELVSCALVRVVPTVLVSPSSVVTEFCYVSSLLLRIENLWKHNPFLSPKSVHIVVQIRKKR